MRIGPLKLISNLSSDVFELASVIVDIDLTHDAAFVDQNVESELFVTSS